MGSTEPTDPMDPETTKVIISIMCNTVAVIVRLAGNRRFSLMVMSVSRVTASNTRDEMESPYLMPRTLFHSY